MQSTRAINSLGLYRSLPRAVWRPFLAQSLVERRHSCVFSSNYERAISPIGPTECSYTWLCPSGLTTVQRPEHQGLTPGRNRGRRLLRSVQTDCGPTQPRTQWTLEDPVHLPPPHWLLLSLTVLPSVTTWCLSSLTEVSKNRGFVVLTKFSDNTSGSPVDNVGNAVRMVTVQPRDQQMQETKRPVRCAALPAGKTDHPHLVLSIRMSGALLQSPICLNGLQRNYCTLPCGLQLTQHVYWATQPE